MRWEWHVARMGLTRNTYRLLVEKSEGKIPLGRPIRRSVDNEMGCVVLTGLIREWML
jgi:hypothetical protein